MVSAHGITCLEIGLEPLQQKKAKDCWEKEVEYTNAIGKIISRARIGRVLVAL